MPYRLSGRKVLVTGGSRGLGALVALKFAAEGSDVAINYVSDKEAAERVCATIQKEHGRKAFLLQGDMGVLVDCKRVVQQAVSQLGGLDIIISNAGWTKIANFSDLDAYSEEEWDKCWAVNVKGHLWVLREALPTFNSNEEGGVFIMTSSVAGSKPVGSSMAYSVSKAAGLHLLKCLAVSQGSKLRANAVLPGLLLTDWGNRFSPEKIAQSKEAAILKKETDLDDCAETFLMIARNSSMTGQGVQVDSGLIREVKDLDKAGTWYYYDMPDAIHWF